MYGCTRVHTRKHKYALVTMQLQGSACVRIMALTCICAFVHISTCVHAHVLLSDILTVNFILAVSSLEDGSSAVILKMTGSWDEAEGN